MKIAVTFLALIAMGLSAPQPRKLFHEHYEDFMDVIIEEAGHELDHLLEHYVEFEEFRAGIEYLMSPRFRNLVYEMEDLPEFKAVVAFLESHNIDILYFVNAINNAVDGVQKRSLRHEISGRNIVAFIQDSIDLFPKEKLTALYEQKIAEFDEFRLAMENFESEEWDQIYSALWENEVFLTEVQELKDNGIDVQVLLIELKAVMGIFKR